VENIKSGSKKRLIEVGLEYIFWIRYVAFFIDYLVLKYLLGAILSVIKSFHIPINETPTLVTNSNLFQTGWFSVILINFAVYAVYASITESSKLQTTFGKWFFRLIVTDFSGQRLSFFKALARNILKSLSVITLLGVWIINLNKKRQGLHDIIAGTIVKLR